MDRYRGQKTTRDGLKMLPLCRNVCYRLRTEVATLIKRFLNTQSMIQKPTTN